MLQVRVNWNGYKLLENYTLVIRKLFIDCINSASKKTCYLLITN